MEGRRPGDGRMGSVVGGCSNLMEKMMLPEDYSIYFKNDIL